jgi:hypothetical protein
VCRPMAVIAASRFSGKISVFVLVMAAGSIVGLVSSPILLPLLAVILLISAVKVRRH